MRRLPCWHCGRLTSTEAIGARAIYRFKILNWLGTLKVKVRRRYRPWHLACLDKALSDWGDGSTVWVHIRTIHQSGDHRGGRVKRRVREEVGA